MCNSVASLIYEAHLWGFVTMSWVSEFDMGLHKAVESFSHNTKYPR